MKNKEIQTAKGYVFEKLSRFIRISFLVSLLPLTVLFLSLIPQDENKLQPDVIDQVTNLKYENFIYLTKETPIYINTISNGSICNISIYNNYFENIEITGISPKPLNIKSDHGNKIFSFLISKPGKQQFIFKTKPKREGSISGVLSVDNKIFALNQFIYSDQKLHNSMN